MINYILLRLKAPIQSWGKEAFAFQDRPQRCACTPSLEQFF